MSYDGLPDVRARRIAVLIATAVLTACARPQGSAEPVSLTADRAWVQSVCDPATPDTTGWPRYQLGNVSIAVPPQYRRGRVQGFSLQFRRGTSTMTIQLGRQSAFNLFGYNVPGQVGCEAHYGGYQTDVLAWHGRGQYFTAAIWERLNEPDERNSVQAIIRTTRLPDAQALRTALHTIRRTADVVGQAGNPDAWFHSPCDSDSVDSFEWTRYDLRALRIRVPRDIRHVPYPDLNELRFQKGQARMRLRVHNDASMLFAEYYKPEKTYRHCHGEMSGLAVEAISFRESARNYGFAARWPDADRGEWLAAVITAPTLAEATALRRALFTISFPGGRGQ